MSKHTLTVPVPVTTVGKDALRVGHMYRHTTQIGDEHIVLVVKNEDYDVRCLSIHLCSGTRSWVPWAPGDKAQFVHLGELDVVPA